MSKALDVRVEHIGKQLESNKKEILSLLDSIISTATYYKEKAEQGNYDIGSNAIQMRALELFQAMEAHRRLEDEHGWWEFHSK